MLKCGDVIRINSYEDIEKIIESLKLNWKEESYKFYFRGQAVDKWRLLPGMLRSKIDEKAQIEEDKTTDTISVKMAAAQHYGKKTRCLDFTRNMDIALYFAVRDKEYENEDGALYILWYYPHDPDWFTNYLMHYISTSNKFILDKYAMEKFAMDKSILEDDKVYDYVLSSYLLEKKRILSEFYRTGRSTELSDVKMEINHYLSNGFLVDFKGKECGIERLKKQEGALYYFGSQYYYNSSKIIDNNIRFSNSISYKINIHELIDHKLEERCIKIVIPKEIKQKIYGKINITNEDLAL